MPLNTVFKVDVTGKRHKAVALLRALSANLGKRSLRASLVVGLDI